MNRNFLFALGLLFWLAVGPELASAQSRFSFGIRFGLPIHPRYHYVPRCYGPSFGFHYHYLRPFPIFVERPVVVRPVPVVVQQPSAAFQAAPSVQSSYAAQPVSTAPQALATDVRREAEINQLLEQLKSPSETSRQQAVLKLGRLKAQQSVYHLATILASDASPGVREAAARALGLIGSPKALATLSHAAKTDRDRDVRRSAQFAVDVIQTNNRTK